MSGFSYRSGILHAEGVSLSDIADAVGTPTYVYSSAVIAENYQAYVDAFSGQRLGIHYSLKANGNLGVVALLAKLGAGADIVSVGELRRALKAGIPAGRIVFSGVGKTPDELAAAVAAGVAQVNVESEAELETLDGVARAAGTRQAVALRINPDVDGQTHEKISTGKRGDKFGIAYEDARTVYARAAAMPGIDAVGLAVHIGSQLTSLEPFREAYLRVADLVRALRTDGLSVTSLDLGGGLGVTYRDERPPQPADYARMTLDAVGNLGCKLAIEPGRSIVGPAGMLLAKVTYRKPGTPQDFVILDAGMNDLMRPAMYGAYHPIFPVREPGPGAKLAPVDVVGPICETGDSFGRGRPLPPLEAGDLVVFGMAGAYGFSMASNYNARGLPAEILVDGDRFDVVRSRQSLDDLFAGEHVPDRLAVQS